MTERSLGPYLSPEARAAHMHALARAVGAETVTYGRSVEQRPLQAVRVPARAPDAPRVLCSANIHGPEFVGGMVALGLLEALGSRAAHLRDVAEVWIVPCINPDGYARTWAHEGRGTLPQLRANARGVDLNRNFPRPWAPKYALPGAGSDHPGDPTYRGPHPLSEPETAALDRLFSEQRFHASINLHSFMGTLIPARVLDREDYRGYRGLCRTFAQAQPHVTYRRLANRWFDVFTGEQEDYQHHRYGTWAVCVEVFSWWRSLRQRRPEPSLFWRFNPVAPQPWIDNEIPGIVAFFEAALRRRRPRRCLLEAG